MLNWWMRWDKPWEDGGRGVCPDSCQRLTHTAQKLNGHSRTPMQAIFFSQSPTCEHISIPYRPFLLHIFILFLFIAQLPSLAPACCPYCSHTLSNCYFLPAVSYFTQEHEQRQSPVDVSKNNRLHKHALAIWRCMKQTDVSSWYICSGSYTSHQTRTGSDSRLFLLLQIIFSFLTLRWLNQVGCTLQRSLHPSGI